MRIRYGYRSPEEREQEKRDRKRDEAFAETADIEAFLIDMSDDKVQPHYYLLEGKFWRGNYPCLSRREKTLKRLLDEHWIEKSIQATGIDLRLTTAGRTAVDLVRKRQADYGPIALHEDKR